MDEKIFNLLEKMYIEVQDIKTNMTKMESNMTKMGGNITKIESNMTRMENDLKKDISALYDGYVQNTEQINRVNSKLDQLIDKVENQEIRLQVLKTAK